MAPSFIYFDMGNVLLNFDHRRACRQMGELARVDPELVWRICFASELEARCETGEVDADRFYETFCQETKTCPDSDALELAASAIFEVNATIVPLVTHLGAAGVRLGVLSNTSASHWKYVTSGRYALMQGNFDVTVLSFKVGAMKPDPRIYQAAIDLAGVPPEAIFFIDDRPENVAGALRAGLDAVVYQNTPLIAQELRQRGLRFNY